MHGDLVVLVKIWRHIDSYVTQISKVATLLGYEEPQILEVFKNTLPTKLYWVPFPTEGLIQAVEAAKRILTKEKLDTQLTGQTSTSPFMNIRDGTERKVLYSARDDLGDKMDKLKVMMGRLAAKHSNNKRPFKPQIYKSRGSYPQGPNRTYNQRNYQNRSRLGNRSDSRSRGQRSDSRSRGQYGQGSNRPRFQQNYRGNNFQEKVRGSGRQNSRGEYRSNRCDGYNRSRDRLREESFSRNYGNNRDRSSSNSRLRSGSRASTNRDRIRCYNCTEYDHFTWDCPTSRREGDLEQLQQMLKLEAEEQTHLLTSRQNNPIENCRTSPLNI